MSHIRITGYFYSTYENDDFLQNSSATFLCIATETLKKEPDSYFPEQQPMLKQLSILQLLECGWPFGDYQPFSYWSAPKGNS